MDEYDKPLLQTIGNNALQEAYRSMLKAFYGVLKTCDRYIRFAFLTGVTKFGKMSVFSDMNNLIDISMLPQFVDICGITEGELHDKLDESVYQSADVALKQIEEKGYAKPFANDPCKLFKIGVNFSTEKRCIDDWRVE